MSGSDSIDGFNPKFFHLTGDKMIPTGDKARVLIIEDEVLIAADLERQLKGLGYAVSFKAGTAEKALEYLEQNPIDLVLSDIVLEDGLDGIEAARIIRDKFGIPVIFITAYADPERLTRAKLARPFGYILKPFKPRDLGTTLEMALNMAGLERERQAAERKLKESEERYKSVVEDASMLICRFRPGGGIEYVNRAFCEYYRQAPEQLIGWSFFAPIIEEDRGEVETALASLKTDRPTLIQSQRVFPAPGEMRWQRWTHRALFDDYGRISLYQSFGEDITEQKLAEAARVESEQRYKGIFDSTKDGAAVYRAVHDGRDFIFEDFNKSAERIDHIKKEELLGRSLLEVFPAARDYGFFEVFQKVYRTGRPERYPMAFYRDNRISGWRDNFVYKLPSGEIVALYRDETERKLAEQQLRESEERYRNIVEHAHDGIFQSTREGRFIQANPAMARICGYDSPEQLISEVTDISTQYYADPNDRIRYLEKIDKYDSIEQFEFQVKRKDGKIIWVSNNTRAIHNPRGNTVIYEGMVKDITERKLAEQALRENEAKLRAIFDTVLSGIFLSDVDGIIIFANNRMVDMLGYELDELIGSEYTGYIHEGELDIARQNMSRLRAGEMDSLIVERKYRRKDGSVFWGIISGSRLAHPDGSYWASVGVIHDITESKKLMLELERIFNMSLYMICIAEIDSKIFIKVNPAFTDTLGFSEEELIGRSFMDFIHPDDIYSTEQVVEVNLKTGLKVVNFENRYRCKDGSFRWLKWVSHPDVEEGVTFAMAQDVTQAKQAEEERIKLENQLLQAHKMEAVGTLAGGVSHDFNNLLQAIGGFTQLLLLDKKETHPDYHNLNAIREAGERAAQLVRQLLLFSRKVEAKRQAVELNREIKKAVSMLERTIPKMIGIEHLPEESLWKVNADPVQIEQVLLNLGINAADAMPEGGSIVIETENLEIDEDFTQYHLGINPGKYVLIKFSDTGSGMNPETTEHIFEPFFTTKEIGKGTGLGLASVYGMVKAHSGYISCYSQVGQGTTFKIYLPATDQPVSEIHDEKSEGEIRGGRETILVVDDDATINEVAVHMLERFGYQVVTAGSGEEALEIYGRQTEKPDLVILDLGMPGMGGHNCLLGLIKIDPAVKVLIASGYSINGLVRKTLDSGARGFIAKPYQLKNLLLKVRSVLDE